MNKKEIRERYLKKRSQVPNSDLISMNALILESFIQTSLYKESNSIMIYISFDKEIDTHTIINTILSDNKKVIVPITDSKNKKLIPSQLNSMDELEYGFYNILTPKEEFIREVTPEDIDLIVVPGIAFGKDGYRIGYGGGYYDRFLKNLNHIPKISLAYDFQVLDSIPSQDYDIPVDYILTNKNFIKV